MPLTELLGGFYATPEGNYHETFAPGQLYWAPTFYLPPHPDVLFEINPDPTEANLRFELRRATPRTFQGEHRPLKSLDLQTTEELVAVKAKKRLVVLLSQANTVMEDLQAAVGRDRKIHEASFLCFPIYGVHRGSGERGFPEVVVQRIQALMYNQFFYFPPSSAEENPTVYEGIGRLDRIQAFHRDALRQGAVRFRVNDDCTLILREWVRAYLTGEMSTYVAELRQELIKELYT